jgi:hypothetical protein
MMHFVNFLGGVGLFASSVFAQCFTVGGQQPSPALNLAPGSEVYDLEVVDRDGTGPQQPVLMIGGMAGGYQWNGATLTTITSSPVRQFASNTSGTLYVLREDNLVEIRPATLPASVLGGFTGQINAIADVNGTLWAGGRVIGVNGTLRPVLTRLSAGRWQDATPPELQGNIFVLGRYSSYVVMGGSLGWPRPTNSGGGLFVGPMLVSGLLGGTSNPSYFWGQSGLSVITLMTPQMELMSDGFGIWSNPSPYVPPSSQGPLASSITALFGVYTASFTLDAYYGTDTGRLFRLFGGGAQPTGILANGPIYAIESFQNDLYIAGGFTEVNGQPAIGVARLLNTGAPQFTQQPSNQQVFATETLTLAAPVANPTDVTFQWSFNGTPIGNGLTQGSQLVSGANTSVLSIQRPRVTMSGIYTLRATNSCGTTTSSPVEVTIVPACDSVDFNNDGIFPDDQDVVAFFRVLAGGQCFE